MSSTVATVVRPRVTKKPGALSQLIGACWQGIARHFARRAAVAHLRKLDDHALRDIGLARTEIEAAVYGLITRSDRARM